MRSKNRIWTSMITASLLAAVSAMPALAGPDRTRSRIEPKLIRVPVESAPQVEVWTDEGDGALLYPGETVDVFFRTHQDAYVVVVDIDTRGRARLLFPEDRYDDGFVRGRKTIAIPRRGAGYKLMVSGPAGVERIVAFASSEPLTHSWRDLIDDDDSFSGAILRDFRPDEGTVWGASLAVRTADARIELAGGSRRGTIEPQLVPVPVDDYGSDVSRDETWFRVGRFGKGRRY